MLQLFEQLFYDYEELSSVWFRNKNAAHFNHIAEYYFIKSQR